MVAASQGHGQDKASPVPSFPAAGRRKEGAEVQERENEMLVREFHLIRQRDSRIFIAPQVKKDAG